MTDKEKNKEAERKQIEEALRRSEEKYRELVENANSIILRRDLEGRITFFNEFAQKFFGYAQEEILGKNEVGTIVPEIDSYGQNLAAMIKDIGRHPERYANNQNENMRRNGERVWISWTNKPIYDSAGKITEILCVGNDITERKKAEQKLQAAYEKLKETQQELIHIAKMAAMGRLAAGISHELNQPLTGIKGFAQAALTDLDKKNLLKSDLKKIVQQADRIDGIIKSVRLFARRSEFKMEKIDINRPLRDSIALLKQQLKVQNIRVNTSLGKDLPRIQGDHNQLQQVFLNLITNARDAIDSLKSPEGGELMIKTFLSKDKKNIEIIFKDTGCGISEEDLRHIFEPFFTTKSSNGDIGLGLSIVYGIIESHQGKIEVESRIGKGTVFKITLPIAQNKK